MDFLKCGKTKNDTDPLVVGSFLSDQVEGHVYKMHHPNIVQDGYVCSGLC